MDVKSFFDRDTGTLTYVVFDADSRDAVVIDPVLDFDPLRWRVSTRSVEQVRQFVRGQSLDVRWVLDTHAHADHLTGSDVLRHAFGAPAAIGRKIIEVQRRFAPVFRMEIPTDGSQWDQLLADAQVLQAGSFEVKALHTPGHTPACVSYLIGDAVFTGHALLMPDAGTGRTDFPGGSAEQLYDSIANTLYRLPSATRVFVGHDYRSGARAGDGMTTVRASKEANIQLRADTGRAAFVAARRARDRELAPPRLMLQSLQVNIDAGRLPAPDASGRRALTMPLGLFD